MLYTLTLPVAAARVQLSKLVDEAASTHERFEVARNAQRVAVLLGTDDYDAQQETIAVLGDWELLRAYLKACALERGVTVDEAQLVETLREAGRLPTRT